MAAGFILAIAAHRKVGLVREGGEQVEEMRRFRLFHLGAKLPLKGLPPASIVAGMQCKGDQIRRGRQGRQPNVIEVAPGEVGFGNAAGRAADRAQAEALMGQARRSEADDGNGHEDRVQGGRGDRAQVSGHRAQGASPGSQE